MVKHFSLFLFLGLNSLTLWTQDLSSPSNIEESSQPIEELDLASLKLRFLEQDLSSEDLFRLASLYLSQGFYLSADELYSFYIEQNLSRKNQDTKLALAHYNRATALFSVQNYNSALEQFDLAYLYDSQLFDALRMMGTVFFIQKNKEQTLVLWQNYLQINTVDSPERQAIANAVAQISQDDFNFDDPRENREETNSELPKSKTWPFLNPDTIPNPRSVYEKKRVI